MDATVVPLHRPRLATLIADLDAIDNRLHSIADGIKILVHDGRLSESVTRRLALSSAMLKIGSVRYALEEFDSLAHVDPATTVDVEKLVADLQKLVADLDATAARIDEPGPLAPQRTVRERFAPRLDLTDDKKVLAAFAEAERQREKFMTENGRERWDGDGTGASEVARVLAGRTDLWCVPPEDSPRPTQGDVVRVGQVLGRLAREGRIRIVSKKYEHSRRYAPALDRADERELG